MSDLTNLERLSEIIDQRDKTIATLEGEVAEAKSVIETKGVIGDVLALTQLHKEVCQELVKAIKALEEWRQAYQNRGEKTSLYEWDKKMKAANEQGLEAINNYHGQRDMAPK